MHDVFSTFNLLHLGVGGGSVALSFRYRHVS
jgi:hypothetical protein